MRCTVVILSVSILSGCIGGSTGSGLVTFSAYASGTTGVDSTTSFQAPFGFHVTLSKAVLHIGAIYLSQTPSSSSFESCIEPGRYVAEVPGPVDVDVLSDTPQPFSVGGNGTEDPAVTGEVWLTGGDVGATEDPTVILDVAGTAVSATQTVPFEAEVTIGSNRAIPITDPSMPSRNPICKRRIVPSIPAPITLTPGAILQLSIDPRGWFDSVNFRQLDAVSTDPPLYRIPDSDNADTAGAAAGRNLFLGLRASAGVYSFSTRNP